jgi:hypothetical protein
MVQDIRPDGILRWGEGGGSLTHANMGEITVAAYPVAPCKRKLDSQAGTPTISILPKHSYYGNTAALYTIDGKRIQVADRNLIRESAIFISYQKRQR